MIRIFIILVFNFLIGCQSVKEGFTLQKQSTADEFLGKKSISSTSRVRKIADPNRPKY